MPIIHLHYIHDLTNEQKIGLTADITAAAVKNMNLPKEHVQVWLHQTSKENHSWGGTLISEMDKNNGEK